MSATRITIALFGVIICMVVQSHADGSGASSRASLCKIHKQKGWCDKSPRVKQICKAECSGDDENEGGKSEEQEPEQKQTTKSTTRRTTTSSKRTTKSKKKCDKRSPCISYDEANPKFQARCAKTSLSPECQGSCRYDSDTQTLKKAFMGGPCKLGQLREYLTAASNGRDNEACCRDTGVLGQKKTDVCGCFCNPTGPVWPGKGEAARYAPCVNVLTGIMNCHYYAEGAD